VTLFELTTAVERLHEQIQSLFVAVILVVVLAFFWIITEGERH
jgi:hypothetical protein